LKKSTRKPLEPKEIESKLSFIGGITHDLREMEAFVRFAEKLPPNPVILETGTCFGKSAASWVLATGGQVFSMENSPMRVSVARNNINTLGLQDNIVILNCDSEKHLWNKMVDVVYLDSAHDYDHLMIELKKYSPFAKHLICGHDYGHKEFPGVQMAVDEYFGDIDLDGSIWYRWL
jgi:predicted O-methyltransferase YrrM